MIGSSVQAILKHGKKISCNTMIYNFPLSACIMPWNFNSCDNSEVYGGNILRTFTIEWDKQ
jgi:hypothetical protein